MLGNLELTNFYENSNLKKIKLFIKFSIFSIQIEFFMKFVIFSENNKILKKFRIIKEKLKFSWNFEFSFELMKKNLILKNFFFEISSV